MRGETFSLAAEGDGVKDQIFYYRDRSGAIWWNSRGGLVRFKDGARTLYTTREGLTSNDVTAISEDRNGNLWIGARDGGLHRLTDGVITAFSDKRILRDSVSSIFEDRGGNLWLLTEGSGLMMFKDGKFTGYTTAQGLSSDRLRTVYQDREGTLWIGALNNGLNRMRKELIHVLTEKDGLSSQNVYSIYEDGDGAIWIGAWGNSGKQGGLTRYKDGKFSRYTEQDGLRNNLVDSLCEDREKRLWISANGGGLSLLEKGKIRDVTDELGLAQYEIRAIYLDRGGVMWLATQRGLLGYRDKLVASYTRKDGLVSIKPEHMSFRYKLEGLDREWVEAGSRRSDYYSHLPPGEYKFVVLAANSDGRWNERGASLRVIVLSPFYLTWWFISFITLALAGASSFAYKRRIRHLKQAKTAQEKLSRWLIDSQENERKRIAAELHDSLSQNLAIIRSRALWAIHSLDYDLAKEQLSEISAQASQVIEEVTEIAYNLRPHFLDRLGLTRAISAMDDRIAKTSGVQWATDLDDLDGLFDQDKEIHIYRMVQESINNVLKHSEASHAMVAIYRSHEDVIITIQDNGKGMPTGFNANGQSSQLGFGLIGIAERARIFGARPSIKSAPGKGTSLTIKLTLKTGRGAQ